MLGSVTLGETESVVLVTENVLDGVFGPEDSWALASQDSAKNVLHPAYSSSMEEHNWLLDQAYRVVEVDPSGRRLLLAPFDPGITRADEEIIPKYIEEIAKGFEIARPVRVVVDSGNGAGSTGAASGRRPSRPA